MGNTAHNHFTSGSCCPINSEHCLLSLFIKQFLLEERDQLTSADRPAHFEKMMKRVENLEEEVKSLKSELFKVNLTNINKIL